MPDYVYVHIENNICYYCNEPHHSELPGIGEGGDPYSSFVQYYPNNYEPGNYSYGLKVKFLTNYEGKFILPEYSTGLCMQATEIINLDKCDASGVYGTSCLFRECEAQVLDLSILNFSSLQFANEMFYNCPNLEYIDLPKITGQEDTLRLFSNQMFSACPKLKRIYIEDRSYWSGNWSGGTDVFRDSPNLPYYDPEDYPEWYTGTQDSDRANTQVEVWRGQGDQGGIYEETYAKGGFFTYKYIFHRDELYEKDSTWVKRDAYIKEDNAGKKCDFNEIEEPQWDIPTPGYEYDGHYYAILPNGRRIDLS